MTAAANSNETKKKPVDLPPGAKLAYTVDEAGPAMGVSRTTVFDMIRNGEVIAKKLRGRTIITRDELQRVIDQAPPARAA